MSIMSTRFYENKLGKSEVIHLQVDRLIESLPVGYRGMEVGRERGTGRGAGGVL